MYLKSTTILESGLDSIGSRQGPMRIFFCKQFNEPLGVRMSFCLD
jgi:hypothetical protein